MKRLLLALIFSAFTMFTADAQICATKCVNQTLTATYTDALGNPIVNAGYTYNWTSTLPGFAGQGTNSLSWASVGAATGIYTITLTVDAAGCDTVLNCQVEVLDGTSSFTVVPICQNQGTVDLDALFTPSPAGGTWSGTDVLADGTYNPADGLPDNLTYTAIDPVSGCGGTSTGTTIVNPSPQSGVITFN